ncbi:hypothetical protein [Thermodesulfovibrio yellowstonii]|uniref:SLAC1 family transporter n=1 Tax=Thermodesulfovibrio yellowstonii TaxID=28262 RepID=UPI003204B5AA
MKLVGAGLTYLSTLIFCLFLVIYLTKTVKYWNQVKTEFHHSVKSNFFPTISISLLLLSIAYSSINQTVAYFMWLIGTILRFVFLIRILIYRFIFL